MDGRLNMAQKNLTLRRQPDPLGAADKKGLVQLFFQNLNRLTDSRLGNKSCLEASEKLRETATW